MDHIVIVGSSGHAKVVIDVVEHEGKYRIAGLLDRYRTPGEETLGYQVLGREEDLPNLMVTHRLSGVIVAIGDNFLRSMVAARVGDVCPSLPFVSAIHPKALIAKQVVIGQGTVIMGGVVVNPCCAIGRSCILNTNSSLDHDSVMEDFSSLAPRAATGGNCRIGSHSAISIGAVLSYGVHIGDHSVIGAGSTVLKDLGSFRVAYGTPAIEVRRRSMGDRYLSAGERAEK